MKWWNYFFMVAISLIPTELQYIKIFYQIHQKIRETQWFTYIAKYSTYLLACIFCLFVYLFICSLNLKYISISMSISIPLSVYLSYVYIYIFIYKTPHDVPNQSGVYLGLKDKNQFLYSFCFKNLIAFYDSTEGSVRVLFSFSYYNFNYIFVCYTYCLQNV